MCIRDSVYTGAIASQKKDYRFKIGTIGEKKPKDWIVVEGQHEPLIDRMSFDIVQNKLKSRQRPGPVSYTHLETEELVSYLNEVVIYNKDNSYTEYAGQAVIRKPELLPT